jgi:hypothetical protein
MSGAACLALWTAPGLIFILSLIWRRFSVGRRSRYGADNLSPAEAYNICHTMLQKMVKQAYYLLPTFSGDESTNTPEARPLVRWGAYTVSVDGLLFAPDTPKAGLLPITAWDSVSGIGVEMAPMYRYAPPSRSFWDISTQVNTGYQFNLLIVPSNGSTLTIRLPLRNNDAAVNFAAHVLAFARFRNRRLSHIGFDKKLTRDVVHLNMF